MTTEIKIYDIHPCLNVECNHRKYLENGNPNEECGVVRLGFFIGNYLDKNMLADENRLMEIFRIETKNMLDNTDSEGISSIRSELSTTYGVTLLDTVHIEPSTLIYATISLYHNMGLRVIQSENEMNLSATGKLEIEDNKLFIEMMRLHYNSVAIPLVMCSLIVNGLSTWALEFYSRLITEIISAKSPIRNFKVPCEKPNDIVKFLHGITAPLFAKCMNFLASKIPEVFSNIRIPPSFVNTKTIPPCACGITRIGIIFYKEMYGICPIRTIREDLGCVTVLKLNCKH